jgi:hypothetical protein
MHSDPAVPHTERVLHPYDDMVDIESVERVEDRRTCGR